MSVRLFDTLQRKVCALSPCDNQTFRFYCCGPTVYGPAHIGNFRTFVLQDVFRRTLELSGTPTFHVRNITDVDDKTIRDSQAAGQTLAEFTQHWAEKFETDCKLLNLLTPHVVPSAVAHIPKQLEMIKILLEKGHAYLAEDNSIYFRVSSFADYGKLSRLDTRELNLGQTQKQRNVDADEYDKDSAADFVLWKAYRASDGPNSWDSPWGKGRPGWHLECSAMIAEHLGKDFDLHGGGEDLIFPHHENEIAQSRCCYGGGFAHHWFHCTHLLVDGAKMSKSLGNLYTLADLNKLGYAAEEVRYLLVSGHYRKQLNFTLGGLDDAHRALQRLRKAELLLLESAQLASDTPPPCITNKTEKALLQEQISHEKQPFQQAFQQLENDLNTPAALGHVFSTLRELKKADLDEETAKLAWHGLHGILAALGVQLPAEIANTTAHSTSNSTSATEVPSKIQELAKQRMTAKQNKDWTQADTLRAQIEELGWKIIDTPDGYHIEPN